MPPFLLLGFLDPLHVPRPDGFRALNVAVHGLRAATVLEASREGP